MQVSAFVRIMQTLKRKKKVQESPLRDMKDKHIIIRMNRSTPVTGHRSFRLDISSGAEGDQRDSKAGLI